MCANKVIFDTSALIELHQGSQKGRAAKELFLAEETQPFVAAVSVAEFSSKLKREAISPQAHVQSISEAAEILPLTAQIAMQAGLLHAQMREKNKRISLADCIIMTHAEHQGAMVVTADHHFSIYKNSRIL